MDEPEPSAPVVLSNHRDKKKIPEDEALKDDATTIAGALVTEITVEKPPAYEQLGLISTSDVNEVVETAARNGWVGTTWLKVGAGSRRIIEIEPNARSTQDLIIEAEEAEEPYRVSMNRLITRLEDSANSGQVQDIRIPNNQSLIDTGDLAAFKLNDEGRFETILP